MKLIDAIETRRSIRKFKNKHIKWSHVLEAIDAALKAPFAGNLNSLRFILVTTQETKNKLAEHSNQDWLAEADTLVVVCSDETHIGKLYEERGRIYSRQQTGAAIQNMLLRLTDLGLGSCWIGAYLDSGIRKDLKIPNHINVEAIVAIGHANEKPKAKRKEALENTIFWEKWDVKNKPTRYKDPQTW